MSSWWLRGCSIELNPIGNCSKHNYILLFKEKCWRKHGLWSSFLCWIKNNLRIKNIYIENMVNDGVLSILSSILSSIILTYTCFSMRTGNLDHLLWTTENTTIFRLFEGQTIHLLRILLVSVHQKNHILSFFSESKWSHMPKVQEKNVEEISQRVKHQEGTLQASSLWFTIEHDAW